MGFSDVVCAIRRGLALRRITVIKIAMSVLCSLHLCLQPTLKTGALSV
jgi:hypothetical protein